MEITASNKEEAIKEALLAFQKKGQDLDPEDLLVERVGSAGGFLGVGKKEVYKVSIKKDSTEEMKAKDSSFPVDGTFKIAVREEGIMLRVTPPENNGQLITIDNVLEELMSKEIVEIDEDTLANTVQKASDQWVKIAPRKKELDRDAKLTFNISKNRMEASVDYLPSLGGKEINRITITKGLKEKKIVHGVKRDNLENLIGKKIKINDLLIAKGTDPTPGKEAYLKYHYERDKKSFGVKREDGSIDFRTLDNIVNAYPGDILVTRVPPEPGKPGKTVTGDEVPPPKPKDIRLPRGKNVEISEDNLLLKSKIEGQVVETGGLVNVFSVYTVAEDVDMEVGNIDFIGNVNIHGNVQEGFSVKARGDVIIKGGVNAALIESGGNIVVGKGFVGRKKGLLKAKGNVNVMFVENGKIMAQGDVTVERAVMHSHIQSGGTLQVNGKGLIVGGTIIVGKEVEAKTIGSSLATPTDIQVGVGPKTRERIAKIEEQMDQYQENLKKTEKGLAFLVQKKREEGKIPKDKEVLLTRMVDTRKFLLEKISELEQELNILGESLMNLQGGTIKVKSKIYPGVTLTIGNAQRRIRDQMSYTSFVFDDGEIISKSF